MIITKRVLSTKMKYNQLNTGKNIVTIKIFTMTKKIYLILLLLLLMSFDSMAQSNKQKLPPNFLFVMVGSQTDSAFSVVYIKGLLDSVIAAG